MYIEEKGTRYAYIRIRDIYYTGSHSGCVPCGDRTTPEPPQASAEETLFINGTAGRTSAAAEQQTAFTERRNHTKEAQASVYT